MTMFPDAVPAPDLLHAQACLIDALSMSLQMRDAYTRHHCDRVGLLAQRLATHCDLDDDACSQIGLAARFHDIGKIGIPDDVLLTPRRHTDEERAIMREHPVRGEHIFLATGRSDAAPVARLIRAHHEAFDGSGYPDGLRGESIPLGSRIVTVADAYDAMTSVRPYRAAMERETALRIIDEQSGGLIDPYVLQRFHRMLAQEPELA
ncbi:HD domain-containing protein [Stenotrophomonas maltophilia]|uniref:HD-GYP domain-containing protein n=1 Tax=Stenotrophomonas maltophilia TaxID=40324 RepID=UPI0015DDD656|nr:HD domain-containing phosphohydrolase [Stenotrophomonas maltophilia]MBA0280963.1 HD domain-containing protein [Stenotrophomonas maltophilia]MBA0344697.1 HD domain-containing protein [Stenotrophomonas maltophilia]MBA0357799.1 HD domain-containing protein [Stenotrophomonas maltophilia]MBA0519829.1 HD domain-containing protein [Stenotrophomonas maltophilia]